MTALQKKTVLKFCLQYSFMCWSNIVALEFQRMPVVLSAFIVKELSFSCFPAFAS